MSSDTWAWGDGRLVRHVHCVSPQMREHQQEVSAKEQEGSGKTMSIALDSIKGAKADQANEVQGESVSRVPTS